VAPQRYDAIILGGGPAGATAALLLAKRGWSVAVVEQQLFPRRKVCGEYLSATNWPLLRAVGLEEAVRSEAGPNIKRVGLIAGKRLISAAIPQPQLGGAVWGRALTRARLDTLILEMAHAQGAEVLQPWHALTLTSDSERHVCQIVSEETGSTCELESAVVIAAHGSWDPGTLPTQSPRRPACASDLLGFKAHFVGAALPVDLMPLLSFSGGYGGMVHVDEDRVSLSCCVRRDLLERLHRYEGRPAGDALLEYLFHSTPALEHILAGATRDGQWLAAGPIRPGVRTCYGQGVFRVGNAAGEAHPAVAEGITMAMQSAWLLAASLTSGGTKRLGRAELDGVGRVYSAQWRRSFAPRIHAAAAVAHGVMRTPVVRMALPWVERFPSLLTWGARRSGKADLLIA